MKDSLNRPVPNLQAIDEEQQTDISFTDVLESSRNNLDISQQSATSYKRAYQNYNQRSQTVSDKKNDDNEENNNEEQIDTIQIDDDRRQQQPQSASLVNANKPSKKPSSATGRPPSSHKQKHRVETMQFNDDDSVVQNVNTINENETEQQKEASTLSKQTKPSSTQNGNSSDNKSRRIRRLQHKLSAQEEDTKKKFDQLQSQQSRLENALKLLVKQTATFKKRRQPTNDSSESKLIIFL